MVVGATISVIMGIHNCGKTLAASILSIINQTYSDWEFIICDDGSTDGSYEIANSYAQCDQRIKVIKNEINCGLATSLNHCLSLAAGRYIARQDGDDMSEPNRLEKQALFLEQHGEFAMVGSWMKMFDEQGEWGVVKMKAQPQKKDFIFGPPFCHATMLIRHDALKKVDAYRVTKYTRRCEDYDLWMRMYAAGFKGYNLAISLYKVRVDHNAYKRRKFKDRLFVMYIGWYGYRILNMPFYLYPFLFRPLLVGLLPLWVRSLHQRIKFRD